MTAVLESVQREAVDHPLDAFVAIVGSAGTGKSSALLGRARRAAEHLRPNEHALVTAAGHLSLNALRSRLGASSGDDRLHCATLSAVAFEVLCAHRTDATDLTLIDDARAEEVFSRIGASLFALEWEEFLSFDLDPEITGMRAPERFAGTAFRLIRKLRMAGLSPQTFESSALRAATAFYGHPPNLANPELLERTQAKYRDSLRAGPAELARQHAREVDLTRILGRLYRAYLEELTEVGCLTAIDALAEAAHLIEGDPAAGARAAARYRYALVDDAQDLTQGHARFLRALFGAELSAVTLAGDPDQRTLAFAGPRAEKLLKSAPYRFQLERQQRATAGVAAAARAVLAPAAAQAVTTPAVTLYRADTMRAEAAYVASAVARSLHEGVQPGAVAVIARSLRCADAYIAALLERNVPVDPAGEGSLYAFADVEDGLCALWSIAEPFRNDWLLRNLEAPWLNLSDASIAALCGEPEHPQPVLFELPAEADDERGRRWDRRRDYRLAWNVLRGDRDAELTPVARERLAAFRAARRGWLSDERHLSLGALARRVLSDTVLAGIESPPLAELSARDRLRRGLIERLAGEIERFAANRPRATLHDYLRHVEHVARADDDLLVVEPYDAGAVAMLGVEAAKGREFAEVYVVDVRAGAFPRYYVPDAFVFTPSHGMIPKENVGDDAGAARTAKFTYFQYKLDVRTRYYAEERRALYCAASRARERLSISASGRATRGIGAPEFLEELRRVVPSLA